MPSESIAYLESWKKILPASRITFPHSFQDRLKYLFWRFYTPFHPFFRDAFLAFGILKHSGRQHFLLGTIAPHTSIRELGLYLLKRGYGNHFIAWNDDGEVVGLRLVKNFKYQYHLRIFEDGEVRGHYEYTPEGHPFLHFKDVGMEERREEFLGLLDGWIAPVK